MHGPEGGWDHAVLASEIAISEALGGSATPLRGFVHIHNPHVPWGGDFNRSVGVQAADWGSWRRILSEVVSIHDERGIDPADRFDLSPPPLAEEPWKKRLRAQGFRLTTATYLAASPGSGSLSRPFSLRRPSAGEYRAWYERRERRQPYFEEEWFRRIQPLRSAFSRVFSPYWLSKGAAIVGSVHCAHLDGFSRLFELEIQQAHRGEGYGRILLNAIGLEARRRGAGFVLVGSGQDTIGFYRRAGFEICSVNSVIRRSSCAPPPATACRTRRARLDEPTRSAAADRRRGARAKGSGRA